MTLRRTDTLCGLAALAMLAGGAGPARAQALPAALTSFAGPSDPAAFAAGAIASGDAQGLPFVVVDKRGARVLAFDARGGRLAETPALLGLTKGDVSPPGIGSMRLADIGPLLRITPAGRYDAHLGINLAGHRILWIDYAAALSLHAVVTGNAREHRLERLATASILDNRISYGCVNVPARFFEDVIVPLFEPSGGIVYILPEDAAP